MEKIKELTKGKAKSLFTTSDDNRLIMHFSDDTSAFDGKKKEALLGKGAVNNQFNAFIMDHLQNNGVETHHIEVLNNNDSLVWNLNMFPIECVIRNRASGSICRRLGTEDGLILESPLFEFFLKDDELGDPLINDEHIISFGWATKDQIDEMKTLTYKGTPSSSSFRKNSNKGLSSIKPSSVPSLLQIEPDALFLITHSIGNMFRFHTSESLLLRTSM